MTQQRPSRRGHTTYFAASGKNNLEQQLQLLPKALHYDLLDYFCCLNFSQRRSFILETLNNIGIAHRILKTNNAFHILVQPNYELTDSENDLFQMKCFVAHYDRRLQTPGTNDNSASIWYLLNLAAQMKRERPLIKTPLQMIFTDQEELCSEEPIRKQGAYMLAQYFRKQNPKLRYAFFVFDQCGIGEQICYLPNVITSRKVLAQQRQILQYIQQNELSRIPIQIMSQHQYYFSDNLGLNLWGYPALLLSTLPQKDIEYWQNSGENPISWKKIQAKKESSCLLEADNFSLMNKLLSRLCRV